MTSESNKKPNELIDLRRNELGLSDTHVAAKVRLSISEYNDAEWHADELLSVVPIYNVKKICDVLKIDFLELFEIPCEFCSGSSKHLDEYSSSRNELIRKKRESMKLTPEQLGDRIGFYTSEVNMLETYTAHLESWVLENVLWLSHLLNVPTQILLDVRCPKCGR